MMTQIISSMKNASREGKVRGLFRLFQRHVMHVRCLRDIRAMERRHAEADRAYDSWFRKGRCDENQKRQQGDRSFSHTLSYLIPTYNTRPELLRALADSLLAQTCDAWEACFYDGASSREDTIRVLKQLTNEDERFHVLFGRENLGISGNTNKALMMAGGDVLALCDHDDLLTEDCTYWLLDAAERGADFIYSDEDKVNEEGTIFYDPHLKADFSPDALRSGNYICHVMAMSAELMRRLGGLRSVCDGSQDHDLALRATEQARAIAHIPRILYHWRMLNTSFSHASQERCALAATRAVRDQLERLELGGTCEMVNVAPQVRYSLPEHTSISLIVHDLDGGLDVRWLRRLLKKTVEEKERICEILVAGHSGITAFNGISVRAYDHVQAAAENATGNLLLLVEQGTMPVWSNWLERLSMFATRPWIGMSGGGLVDARQNYLACGYAVHVPGGAIGRFHGENRFGITYQLYDRSPRECTAVSSALLMIRTSLFLALGGFELYQTDLGAVALGLRAQQKGLSSIVVPEAVAQASRTTILRDPFSQKDLLRFGEEFPAPCEHAYSVHFERQIGSMTVDFDRHEQPVTVLTKYDHAE